MSPPRGPATQALVAAVLGLAASVVLSRACERVVPDVGPRVEVHPAIRAWDAGARRDR